MAHTTFTNGVTLSDATWFQDVDTVTYTLFGNGTSYTGVLTLAGTTQSTSTSTGQAIIAGGMGLAKNLWVGGTGNFAGAVTLQSALTYGGVTLSNAVTGTGNMVLSASPTFTGTITAATIGAFTLGGTIAGGGNQINNVIIGTSTPLAGTFTTLTASGLVDVSGAAAGQVKFPATQNASSNANTFDDYDEYTAASTACTGAITATVAWRLVKIGSTVTLFLPQTQSTASASNAFTFGTAIPAKYRPSATMEFMSALIQNNGTSRTTPGTIEVVSATGAINVYLDQGTTNWTAGVSGGLYATSVSWPVAF